MHNSRESILENNKLWEELITFIPLIWHRPYRYGLHRKWKNYGGYTDRQQSDLISCLLFFQMRKLGSKLDQHAYERRLYGRFGWSQDFRNWK
jgi:hypothetical protein